VHHAEKWEKFKHQLPTTRDNIPYGTPDLALEIERLNENIALKSKTIIMADYQDGVISFKNNMKDRGDLLSHYRSKFSHKSSC